MSDSRGRGRSGRHRPARSTADGRSRPGRNRFSFAMAILRQPQPGWQLALVRSQTSQGESMRALVLFFFVAFCALLGLASVGAQTPVSPAPTPTVIVIP